VSVNELGILVSNIFKATLVKNEWNVERNETASNGFLSTFRPNVFQTFFFVVVEGIQVSIFFFCLDVYDDVEYLSSLGKAQTAAVKRDATVGVAQANRDAGIRVSDLKLKHSTGSTSQIHLKFSFETAEVGRLTCWAADDFETVKRCE
jgi:hypothetical protein